MSRNYSAELGRLLVYIANVATAIRKNSAYNESYGYENRENLALDVMWLADSLHCLDRLGRALLGAPESEIIEACDSLIGYYRLFTEGPDAGRGKLKGDPKASIERYEGLFSPQEAIEVFSEIRTKALGNDVTYVPVLGISAIEQLRANYSGDEAQAIINNTNLKVCSPKV